MDRQRCSHDHNPIKNNTGSTLVTVIVAIAFVTILTSILIGTTIVNVRMKGIDKRTKDDFYYAERALNDIYTGLGQELSQKAADDYEISFKKVGYVDAYSGDDFNHAKTAELDFRKNYIATVYGLFVSPGVSPDLVAIRNMLGDYITSTARTESCDGVDGIAVQDKDGNDLAGPDSAGAARVALKGVKVSATDSSGFRSVIKTDIIINIPTLDFLGTNADVSDYGLIAGKGLYIEGGTNTVTGNVFAGVHDSALTGVDSSDYKESYDENARSNYYGGININGGKTTFEGNYIVSKGDITLTGSAPELIVNSTGSDANPANLWFTSLRTISKATNPKINIKANTFAFNDLALNADNSNVTLKGNYYGYNDETLSVPSAILGEIAGREDSKSSTIIINGSKASLDMTDVDNFVLMGKAYIDFTSDTQTKAASIDADKQIVPTAEGVALKTNQQLYLMPNDFLDEPNPMLKTVGEEFHLSILESDYRNWFGFKYLRLYDPENPAAADDIKNTHKKYKVVLNDGSDTTVYYDYLMFDEKKTWLPVRDADDKVIGYDPALNPAYDPLDPDSSEYLNLGTGGAVSSKAAFFFEVMNAGAAAKTQYEAMYNADPRKSTMTFSEYVNMKESEDMTIVQPSAYRLYERVMLSMENAEYFDLKKCVVGKGTADAHYYAKNAVINYERDGSNKIQSNVFENTEGMGRYASYTQNLFQRYAFLCTKLDGKENILLESEPEPDDTKFADIMTDWTLDTSAPMKYFVSMTNLAGVNAGGGSNAGQMDIATCTTQASGVDGLKPGAFGVVIATRPLSGTLKLDDPSITKIGDHTFKGIAIVDGNIEVPNGYAVDGLLMATGAIILKGNNTITYDRGLVQSRIDKEIDVIKNDDTAATWAAAVANKDYLLIKYLTKSNGTSLLYEVQPGTKVKRDRIEADYNEFVHYENWHKGEE